MPNQCQCAHREINHVYVPRRQPGDNRGPCLARGCRCARFALQVRDSGEREGAGSARMEATTKATPSGASTPCARGLADQKPKELID